MSMQENQLTHDDPSVGWAASFIPNLFFLYLHVKVGNCFLDEDIFHSIGQTCWVWQSNTGLSVLADSIYYFCPYRSSTRPPSTLSVLNTPTLSVSSHPTRLQWREDEPLFDKNIPWKYDQKNWNLGAFVICIKFSLLQWTILVGCEQDKTFQDIILNIFHHFQSFPRQKKMKTVNPFFTVFDYRITILSHPISFIFYQTSWLFEIGFVFYSKFVHVFPMLGHILTVNY